MLIALPIAVLVAVLAGRRVASATGASAATGYLLTLALAGIVAVTMVPMPPGFASAEDIRCLVPDLGVLTSGSLLRLNDESLNVLLFVPLGIAVAWLPGAARTPALVLAVALPWLVESVQLVFPSLGRTCQSVDLTTNLLGLLAGLVAGLAWRRAVRRGSRRDA